MAGFDAIIGQPLTIRLLQTFIRTANVPHALLFTGQPGVGKHTVARTFAAALNCEQAGQPTGSGIGPLDPPTPPCGKCRSCHQIFSELHPDILRIAPQGAFLRIDQIRDLRNTLAMKPFAAAWRVVIITDGQRMNPEAGNALLKLLEEPPDGTILIITALQPSDLLPTIVSRCRHIRFNPIRTDAISAFLVENQGVDLPTAEQAARLSGGSLGRALHLLGRPYQAERDWLIRAAGLDRPAQLADRPIHAALAFAAQLAERKERVRELLEILQTYIRDMNIYPVHPDKVVNQDLVHQLAEAGKHTSLQQTLHWWETVAKAQKAIAGNANLRLTLDVMAIGLCRPIFGGTQAGHYGNNTAAFDAMTV